MNYKDYRTSEPISREQYIKRGLERGKLLYKYDCDCVIIQDRTCDAYIVYCSKHEAAPDQNEALGDIVQWFMEQGFDRELPQFRKAQKALTKAGGKEQ